MTNHIASHLWFDKEALEAATFYCDVFPDSAIRHTGLLRDTPSGDCETVSFSLMGCPFEAISAGPYFSFNPSISFIVNFDPSRDPDARARLDEAWDKLSVGGTVLMPLGRYPFSEHYGWIKDKYGVSWQIVPAAMHEMLANGTREQIDRVTRTFLKMKKIDIGKLQEAFVG